MKRRWRLFRDMLLNVLLLGLMGLTPAPLPAAIEPQEIKQVLVLFSFRTILPAQAEIDQGLRAALQAKSKHPVDIDIEYLDLTRFDEAAYLDDLLHLLRRKYAHRHLDAIIPIFDPAVQFVLKYGDAVFPDVPVVFAAEYKKTIDQLSLKPQMTGAMVAPDFAFILELALTLQPQTRQVVVVGGTADFDRFLMAWAREAFAPWEGKVTFSYLSDLSLAALQERLAQLPPHTIVYYLTILRDGSGQEFVPRDVLKLLAKTANAPVYGLYDTLLGEGIVGGPLVNMQEQGRLAGELTARILNGEKPGQIPPVLAPNPLKFDWWQLRRWGISKDKLPSGSIVHFREPSLWDLYWGWIIGGLALLGLQSGLIGGLLLNHSRRQRAEQSLLERLQFEEVLSGLSAAIINLPSDQIAQEIDAWLANILKILSLERITVLEISEDKKQFITLHSSTAPGIAAFPSQVLTATLPWFTRTVAQGEKLAFSHLPDGLPPEAIQEKEYCRQEGLKSIISLPLQVGGTVLGVITFSKLLEYVDWDRYPITRLNLVAEIFANAFSRRRTQQALNDRLRFEELLTDLSAAFVNLPADRVEAEIKHWHGQILDCLKVERSSVHIFSPDRTELLVMSSLVIPGVQPYSYVITKDVLPWYFERVYHGETLVLARLPDDLPGGFPKERDYCLESGLRSYVCVPLAVAGEVLGTLTMEFFTHYVDWPPYLIRRLRLVGEIFANALVRRSKEEKLRRAEVGYRIVADFTYDWEYWENPEGGLNYVSPACERITGHTVAAFLARPSLLWELILPEDRDIWDRHQAQIQQEHNLVHPAIQFRLRRKDDSICWLEHVCRPVYGSRGEFLGFRASNRDITRRKQIEIKEQQQRDELAHVMRVATLGELTASLAHEFNQPLNALLNNAQAGLRFLNREQPDLAEVTAALQDIVRDGKRANAVIQRLRGFLQPGLMRLEAVEVNAIVEETVALIDNELRANHITRQLHLSSDLPLVKGDPIQLQQVVLNLLLNAMEAMHETGSGQREIQITTAPENPDYLAVSVRDRGKGLQPEEVEKIFEPFYSRKAEGMGLGLSICRSIIAAHGGKLWASQNPDRGATLTFTLPIYQEDAS